MCTIFDYVFCSISMDIEMGYNISGWIKQTGVGPNNDVLLSIIDDSLHWMMELIDKNQTNNN